MTRSSIATVPKLSQELLNQVSQHSHVVRCLKNRQKVATNPYRPLYHMSAPDNLIHDPNGLCQWQGRYHLFFQYFKEMGPGPTSLLCWGHAYSEDLLHWQDLPVAIHPTVEERCFSGQTLVEEDRVIAMYHGTKAGNMIATAEDPLLLDWQMHPDNPVLPMHTESLYYVFDPCIWKEADGYYYSLSGGGDRSPDCVGEMSIFRSKDLSAWEWLGPMYSDAILAERGEDMAVPNFWPIGNGKHLLLCFSHKRAGRGYVGTFDPETVRFEADSHFRANYGPLSHAGIHAPSATIDDKGRYIGIFNMKEAKGLQETKGLKHEGWDGIMSLPRVYSLAEDNSLRIEPIEEVESLRFNHQRVESVTVSANEEKAFPDVAGKAIEIKAVIRPGKAKEVRLKVLQSPDDSEYTMIRYSSDQTLLVDTSHASLLEGLEPRPPETGPFNLGSDEPLELRIFIDRSVVEVFANGRQCLCVRVYPTQDNSRGISIFSQDGEAELVSLDVWQMRSVWPELKNKESN